jgi:hypothetical protein
VREMPRARATPAATHTVRRRGARCLGDLTLELSRVPQTLPVLRAALRRQAPRGVRESLVHPNTSLLPGMVSPQSRADKTGQGEELPLIDVPVYGGA